MLLTLLLAGSLANGPSVDEILEKAIAVQRQHEEAGNEVKYDYELLSVSSKAVTSTTSLMNASSRKTERRSPKKS